MFNGSQGTALLAGVLAGGVVTAGVAVMAPTHAEGPSQYSPVITWVSNRPCAEEDSVNCAWNAGERGNHHGHSFIVRKFRDGTVCYMYDQRRFARRHDHCSK